MRAGAVSCGLRDIGPPRVTWGNQGTALSSVASIADAAVWVGHASPVTTGRQGRLMTQSGHTVKNAVFASINRNTREHRTEEETEREDIYLEKKYIGLLT